MAYTPSDTPGALDWSPGSYVLVRLPRGPYRDKVDAEAEVLRRYPGAQIGPMQAHVKYWVFKIRPKEEPHA
jgi:hypothetical protein